MISAMIDHRVTLAGMMWQSPLVAAAGTAGYVRELPSVLDVSVLGALTTKSITAESREGNPPWRVIDLPVGMLNAIGLANMGVDRFVAEELPHVSSVGCAVIVSIAGHAVDDYVRVAAAMEAAPEVPAVELNVSCPNTATGLEFGGSPARLAELLAELRPILATTRMIVKLSPSVGDVVPLAEVAIRGGADALTLINTLPVLAIDVRTRRPRLSRGIGGLSGPAIHPLAVRIVSDVHRACAAEAEVPIIGLGGVLRWEDAAEFILAGATAVGVGTALYVDPSLPKRIHRGLGRWAADQGVGSFAELRGALEW